jgi:hypothetical protein
MPVASDEMTVLPSGMTTGKEEQKRRCCGAGCEETEGTQKIALACLMVAAYSLRTLNHLFSVAPGILG